MLRFWDATCAGVLESVTFALKLYVPVVVGVPERTPVEESVTPGGKVPVEVHVSGTSPPFAVSVVLNAVFSTPGESAGAGKLIGVVTAILRFTEFDTPLLSVIFTVNVVAAATAGGVPEI